MATKINEQEERIKIMTENSDELSKISENLAIAATIISNTSETNVPAKTISSIQSSLITELMVKLEEKMKSLENTTDLKILNITEEAGKESKMIKEKLNTFIKKYNDNRFKSFGYVSLGEDGLYIVSSSAMTWYI